MTGAAGPRDQRLDGPGLDLGCGRQGAAGFIGLDRFPLPGVDVVGDLDRGLPFATSSFGRIVAFHSLKHVADLQGVLREVFRVARPGARITVAGPYWAQGIHVANPYHRQNFNEHSPRFWTDFPTPPIPRHEYARPPQGDQWGLASSDNSAPSFDLRCVSVEFFHFAEYWGLGPVELADLRRRGFDVCEQILFRLVAFKPPFTEADLDRVRPEEFYDPPILAERRRQAHGAQPRRFSWIRLFRRLRLLGRV